MTTEKRDPTIADYVALATKLNEEFVKLGRAFAEQFRLFMDSPGGRQLAALAKYYDEHPEELERLREANRPKPTCDCLCARWDHRGVCTMKASTEVPIHADVTGLIRVPMCEPCAGDIQAKARVKA